MPPAVSRMLTPDISFEIAKSSTVTWRAQPPFWMRFGALLKEAQSIAMPPTSVAGGNGAEGTWLPMAGLCGPGSARFPGALPLIAPCGGRSGLPKEAARAAVAVITAPAADTASMSRLENMIITPLQNRWWVLERYVHDRRDPLNLHSECLMDRAWLGGSPCCRPTRAAPPLSSF